MSVQQASFSFWFLQIFEFIIIIERNQRSCQWVAPCGLDKTRIACRTPETNRK